MGLFDWLKNKNLTQAVKEADRILELQNKAKEKVDKEFEPKFPYDINNVSSPVLIIAEKWKNDPKRVKVRPVKEDSRVYRFFDKPTKVEVCAMTTSNFRFWIKKGEGFGMNLDECHYLLSECKEALETRCNLVQSRYNRLKGYKKVLKENEERKRIQKLFEES